MVLSQHNELCFTSYSSSYKVIYHSTIITAGKVQFYLFVWVYDKMFSLGVGNSSQMPHRSESADETHKQPREPSLHSKSSEVHSGILLPRDQTERQAMTQPSRRRLAVFTEASSWVNKVPLGPPDPQIHWQSPCPPSQVLSVSPTQGRTSAKPIPESFPPEKCSGPSKLCQGFSRPLNIPSMLSSILLPLCQASSVPFPPLPSALWFAWWIPTQSSKAYGSRNLPLTQSASAGIIACFSLCLLRDDDLSLVLLFIYLFKS